MLRVLLLSAVMGVAIAGHAEAKKKPECQTDRCEARVDKRMCSQKRVIPCIRYAARRHRQPLADMIRVARCESGLDPFNYYAGHHGLYQFLGSTWATTPYARHWIYSARYQALATAWMWSAGRRGEWACQ